MIITTRNGKEYEVPSGYIESFLQEQIAGKDSSTKHRRQKVVADAQSALENALERDQTWRMDLFHKGAVAWETRMDKTRRAKETQEMIDEITNRRTEERQTTFAQIILLPIIAAPTIGTIIWALGGLGIHWSQVAAALFFLFLFLAVRAWWSWFWYP
jgi:TPP-dependent trihydroxycyclohexane-1,2-dione (THcHDO) dehydratase